MADSPSLYSRLSSLLSSPGSTVLDWSGFTPEDVAQPQSKSTDMEDDNGSDNGKNVDDDEDVECDEHWEVVYNTHSITLTLVNDCVREQLTALLQNKYQETKNTSTGGQIFKVRVLGNGETVSVTVTVYQTNKVHIQGGGSKLWQQTDLQSIARDITKPPVGRGDSMAGHSGDSVSESSYVFATSTPVKQVVSSYLSPAADTDQTAVKVVWCPPSVQTINRTDQANTDTEHPSIPVSTNAVQTRSANTDHPTCVSSQGVQCPVAMVTVRTVPHTVSSSMPSSNKQAGAVCYTEGQTQTDLQLCHLEALERTLETTQALLQVEIDKSSRLSSEVKVLRQDNKSLEEELQLTRQSSLLSSEQQDIVIVKVKQDLSAIKTLLTESKNIVHKLRLDNETSTATNIQLSDENSIMKAQLLSLIDDGNRTDLATEEAKPTSPTNV